MKGSELIGEYINFSFIDNKPVGRIEQEFTVANDSLFFKEHRIENQFAKYNRQPFGLFL